MRTTQRNYCRFCSLKVSDVREHIEACEASRLNTRSYSPDLKPIEKAWFEPKTVTGVVQHKVSVTVPFSISSEQIQSVDVSDTSIPLSRDATEDGLEIAHGRGHAFSRGNESEILKGSELTAKITAS